MADFTTAGLVPAATMAARPVAMAVWAVAMAVSVGIERAARFECSGAAAVAT